MSLLAEGLRTIWDISKLAWCIAVSRLRENCVPLAGKLCPTCGKAVSRLRETTSAAAMKAFGCGDERCQLVRRRGMAAARTGHCVSCRKH